MSSTAFVIEVDDQTVGLAVRDGGRFRFISAIPALQALDRSLHPSFKATKRAATAALRKLTPRRESRSPFVFAR